MRMVSRVVESAERVKKLGDDFKVVGFIDECTSTSVMGMVKEVLVDKTLNGIPLPKNVMWVGAFNRNIKKHNEKTVETTTGLDDDGELDFAVRPPP